MGRLENYLCEYSKSHQNAKNILIHKFCVPVIMFSTIGLLKAIPVPEIWPLWFDWSVFFIVGALLFYASLKNLKLLISMTVFIFFQYLILEKLKPHFFILSLILFIIAWICQFVGHKIEGAKPSFFKDVFFLLIGPLWVIKNVFLNFKINNAKDI